MKRMFLQVAALLVALGLCLHLAAQTPAAATSRIGDSGSRFSPERARTLEERLHRFERKTGIRVLFEFHPNSPTEAEDSVPGAYMRALSSKLGVSENGALAVHFADEDEWRVWIGDALTARFVGKPGTAQEHTESGAMHDAKEAWLEGVFAKSDAAWRAAAAGSPKPEDRAAYSAEAIADGLITKFSNEPGK